VLACSLRGVDVAWNPWLHAGGHLMRPKAVDAASLSVLNQDGQGEKDADGCCGSCGNDNFSRDGR
jgi:hypothetical protein